MSMQVQTLARSGLGLSLLLLILGQTAQAKDNLPDILRFSVARSQLVGADREGIAAASAAKAAAAAGYRPTVQSFVEYGTLNTRSQTDPLTSFTERNTHPRGYGVQVNYNLWNGFKTDHSVAREQANIESAAEKLENTQQSVLLDAATAYVTVIRDRVSLRLYQSNLEVMRFRAREMKARIASGVALATDLDQAQAYVSKAEADEVAARSVLDTSMARYLLAVGKPAGDLAVPRVPRKRIPASLREALTLAGGSNPAIRSDEAAARAAHANVKVAKAAYAPSVDLTASSEQRWDPTSLPGANELKTTGASLRVTFPIYSGGLTPAQVDQAEALSRQQALRLDYQRRNVDAAVTAAWNQYHSTGRIVAALRAQVRSTDRSLDGLQKGEKAGTKIALEVYEGRRLLVESRLALANAERDEIVAAYNLLATLGILSVDSLPGGAQDGPSELSGNAVLLSEAWHVLEPLHPIRDSIKDVALAREDTQIMPSDMFRKW